MEPENSAALQDRLERIRELENRLTFRVSVISKSLDQQSQEMLEGSPVTLTGYRIMLLARLFDAPSISEISRLAAMDRAQISRTAAALAELGLVAFEDDPESRRKKNVVVTAAGDAFLDEAHPKFLARQTRIREALGEETYEALMDGLAKLGEALKT